MNKTAAWVIAVKDMRAITSNIQVWLPMAILPAILGVLLPAGLVWALSRFSVDAVRGMGNLGQFTEAMDKLPAGAIKDALGALPTVNHQVAYLAVNYLMAPLFLLVPVMAASVVAANSLVGEKERGTLESLLFAPVDLTSLFVGKVLSALVPAVLLSLVTFLLYGLAVNLLGWPLFGRLFFPTLNWAPLMLVVMPMASLACILANVFISARVADFQAAYQLSGMVVLPVLLLLFGQFSGAMMLDAWVLLALGLLLAALNAALLRGLVRRFSRNGLFESQVR